MLVPAGVGVCGLGVVDPVLRVLQCCAEGLVVGCFAEISAAEWGKRLI